MSIPEESISEYDSDSTAPTVPCTLYSLETMQMLKTSLNRDSSFFSEQFNYIMEHVSNIDIGIGTVLPSIDDEVVEEHAEEVIEFLFNTGLLRGPSSGSVHAPNNMRDSTSANVSLGWLCALYVLVTVVQSVDTTTDLTSLEHEELESCEWNDVFDALSVNNWASAIARLRDACQ